MYELWRNAHVDPRHEDLKRPDICGLMSNPLSFGHRLRLLSGYEICTGKEAPYTNYTEDFKGTLDYIWFTPDTLSALWVSEVDSIENLNWEMWLPSSTRPSDHISLVTTFMFCDPPDANRSNSTAAWSAGSTTSKIENITAQQQNKMNQLQMRNQARHMQHQQEYYQGYYAHMTQ